MVTVINCEFMFCTIVNGKTNCVFFFLHERYILFNKTPDVGCCFNSFSNYSEMTKITVSFSL